MAPKKQSTIVTYDIPGLTAKRAADSTTTIHQAIAMLLNAPHQTMTEQNFLTGLATPLFGGTSTDYLALHVQHSASAIWRCGLEKGRYDCF